MAFCPFDPPDDVISCHGGIDVRVLGAVSDPTRESPGQTIQLDARIALHTEGSNET